MQLFQAFELNGLNPDEFMNNILVNKHIMNRYLGTKYNIL